MNTKEVTAIAFKLLALWLLAQMLIYVPGLVALIGTMEILGQDHVLLQDHLYIVIVSIFLLVGAATAYLLLRVANSILSSLPEEKDKHSNNLSQAFLLQLAGAFFIVSAFTTLTSALMGFLKIEDFNISRYFYLIGMMFEMTVGFYLLLKPNSMVTLFARWRENK